MYPLVFFYSSDSKKELNDKKELVKNSLSGTEQTLRSFIGESIKSATFSKDGDSVEVLITSSGTIIAESNDNDKVRKIFNSFLLALALLKGWTCFFCQRDDLNKITIEPSGDLSPQINNHWSIGRVVASSKDHFEDEVRFSMIGLIQKDIIDQVIELANEFYRSKQIDSYMREYEALKNFSQGNFDTAFASYWVLIELFLKNYSGKKLDITSLLNSLIGIDNNGKKIKRKRYLRSKYIPIKVAKNLKECYEVRKELMHEGRVCTKEEVEKCRGINIRFWGLVERDKIDYDSYLKNVNQTSP